MIRLDDISVSLPGRTAQANTILSGVTLEIPNGDWVVLTGPNGSGKTTLLKALAGLIPLSAGSILLDRCADRAPRFSLMLQDPANQFVASTVWNELMVSAGGEVNADSAPRTASDARALAENRVRESLERFRLGDFVDRNPHHLSGGEQQRLAMATVWLERPDVLLLDEPVSFLDGQARMRCIDFVRELNLNGATVIWASPGGDELLPAATIVYLEEGKVLFSGPRDRFLAEARTLGVESALPQLLRIGGALSAALRAGTRPSGETPAAAAARRGPEVLAFQDVSFSYRPGSPALRSVSAALSAGECLGVTGPNGSGKTTMLELAGRILAPDSGVVAAHPGDRPRDTNGSAPACLIDCFYLVQGPERMFFTETVFEEIAFGLRRNGIGRDACSAAISDALFRVGLDLEAFAGRSPFRLSFGEMRRLALAIAVSLKPGVLLLDEPSACLDDAGMTALGSVLKWWRAEGRAVMIASHDIDFLAETCDRILFLERGSVIDELPIAGGILSPSRPWPGGTRPCVLALQEALDPAGTRFPRRVLSRELFVRELLDDAESDIG